MDSTALEFCYTKAAGLLSTSFLNQRMSLLFNSKSLVELWAVLFSDSVPAVPEALLADEIEKKAFNNEFNNLILKFIVAARILAYSLQHEYLCLLYIHKNNGRFFRQAHVDSFDHILGKFK